MRKFVRRNRGAVLAANTIALLLVLGLALGLPRFLKSSRPNQETAAQVLPPRAANPNEPPASTSDTILSDLNPAPERPAILFNRWQEDWLVLADPRVPRQPFDEFNYIPLSDVDPYT